MKKKGSRYNTTLGKFILLLPVLIIGSLVVYGYVTLNAPGTLIVRAETPACTEVQTSSYTGATISSTNDCELNASVQVNGKSGQTPWTLSLGTGTYTVAYASMQWYYTPSSKTVSVSPGLTAYAVGVYSPIARIVEVTPDGFNTTTADVLTGVTPVNWTNPTDSAVTFQGKLPGSNFGDITLEPGQTIGPFLYYSDASYTVLSTDYQVSIDVVSGA